MSISLHDDFDNPVGAFPNYATYDAGQETQLARQRHVDIRTFETPGAIGYAMWDLDQLTMTQIEALTMLELETNFVSYPEFSVETIAAYSMFDLAALTMQELDALTMLALESEAVVFPHENWSAGAVAPQTDRHYFPGISLTCASGTTSTFSVNGLVNIGAFSQTDYISLALPAFPLASITQANTFLDLTSERSGNFSVGPTDSIPFSASTTTLIAGDCEARFPLSLLTTINRSAITGVRFRIQATGACTFRCLAIRCLAATWDYAPVDQNTLYDRIGATVPPTGSLSQSYAFPTAGAPVTPADWPSLLFSDGEAGPGLVDIETGAVIHTGMNNAANTFTLLFRELPMLTATVNSLDTLTMASLEGLGGQPEYNDGTLNDFAETNFLTVSMQWGTSGAVHIKNQSGTGYDFTGLTFIAQRNYYLLVQLVDDSLRVRIYPISAVGYIDFSTVVFDSTAVIDNAFVQRRRGRLGWYAHFGEGGTYVKSLRPRRTVYGEYRSAALASVTPVEGARLFTSATPDGELYPGAIATPGAVLSPDVTKSRSGRCIRVQCGGNHNLEGLVTDPVLLTDLYDTEIEFDVLAPFTAKLEAVLYGENRLLPLYLSPFATSHWTHVKIPLASLGPLYMPGSYALYIVQTAPSQNTWYIDNPSIHARSVSWQGRGQAADPRKMVDPDWVTFGDAINDPHDAALLGRGRALQIRGQVLTPDASITGVQILPKYAELGNFVWSEDKPTYATAPVPSFTTASTSMHVRCDGSASTATAGIASYYWTFGDGQYGYGETIAHDYAVPGNYVVNLTLIDTQDQKVSTTQSVTV